jgi:ubiquinol-cytochrome c reductase cytochrome b subunit
VSGQNNPTGVEVKNVQRDTLPFTPFATVKDSFALVMFLIFFSWWIFYVPNYLGHADNYIEANPLVTPAHIVPEWYFLPFYAILRAIPSKLGGVIAMFGSIAILAFLPWLDTSKVRSANYRPVYRVFFIVFVLTCIGLGYLGAMPAEGGYVLASRLLTLYYFGFFLVILPLLGLYETTKPLPATIADSVLPQGGAKLQPAE